MSLNSRISSEKNPSTFGTASSKFRLKKRDKRKVNDKYARNYTQSELDSIINTSQNPNTEDYVVISGKHTFNTQRAAVFKKLEELKILSQSQTLHKKIKPELVNLIPQLRGKDPRGFEGRRLLELVAAAIGGRVSRSSPRLRGRTSI